MEDKHNTEQTRRGGSRMLTLIIAVCAGVAAFTIAKPLIVGDSEPPWSKPAAEQQASQAPPDTTAVTPQMQRLLDQASDLRSVTSQANLHRQLNGTYVGAPVPAGVVVLSADTEHFVIARNNGQCEVAGVISRTARSTVIDPTAIACGDPAVALSMLAQ